MKILIVTQYFWPEFFLINRISQKLTELNHEVTIATGKPNYPHGITYEGYQASGVDKESFGDVEIIRVPLRPRGKGAFNLVANYLSFVYSGIRYLPALLKGREFDFILVFAPSPITTVIPAIWLNRKLKSHLTLWVQDLWPQSLEATGYVTNKKVLRLVGLLVKWIYSKCDTILAQSYAFIPEIERYTQKDKILYYPNSIEEQKKSDNIVLPEEIKRHFVTGFNFVFTGNIGSAQSIPMWLNVATKLIDTDCRFIFIGDGSLEQWARDETMRLKIPNVFFLGGLENSMMPIVYELADALLISLTNKDIFSYTIPGKLQAYLSAGKPIVASLNGEPAEIINKAKAGIVCSAEDDNALVTAIRKFRLLPENKRNKMGIEGRKYFKENYDMNVLVPHLVSMINGRIEANKK